MATTERSAGDSWDLASSVGATATMVAAARAVASAQDDPIINDPFAAPLVRAVGLDFFTRLVDGDLPIEQALPDAADGRELQFETDSIAVRTRFFDDFFLDAARDGVRQAVILAAGLDARGIGCPGLGAPWCTKSTSPRSSNSRTRQWRRWAPPRRHTARRSASTCAMTGQKRCAAVVSTPRRRPPGALRVC